MGKKSKRDRKKNKESNSSVEEKIDNTSAEVEVENENENVGKYAILMETNGQEIESWYYFIKYQGNQKALKYLNDQLDKMDMYIIDDLSTFDIELEHLVSETTAKEMTKLEINSVMFHRKFDGKLKMINLELKKKHPNERMLIKLHEKLGLGQIEQYIDGEDIDEEDLENESEVDNYITDSDDEELVPKPE